MVAEGPRPSNDLALPPPGIRPHAHWAPRRPPLLENCTDQGLRSALSVGLAIGLALVLVVAVAAVGMVLRTRSSVESRVADISDGLGYTAELAASLDPADV